MVICLSLVCFCQSMCLNVYLFVCIFGLLCVCPSMFVGSFGFQTASLFVQACLPVGWLIVVCSPFDSSKYSRVPLQRRVSIND